MTTYLVIVLMFAAPLAMSFFANTFFPDAPLTRVVDALGIGSPITAAFSVPMAFNTPDVADLRGSWPMYTSYVGFTILFNTCLLGSMIWLFNTRWRVAE